MIHTFKLNYWLLLSLLVLLLSACGTAATATVQTEKKVVSCSFSDYTWTEDLDTCRTALVISTPTPIPTDTSEPTVPFNTPTPESTFTPFPTNTPEPTKEPPEPTGCYGTVLVDGLRIRVTPNGTIKYSSGWLSGDRLLVLDVEYIAGNDPTLDDEWAQVRGPNEREGWSAALWSDELVPDVYERREYLSYDNSQECLDIRFGDTQPERPALMWHFIPGGNGQEALASFVPLRENNIAYGNKTYSDVSYCLEALNAGGECIYRKPPDCPIMNLPASSSAEIFMSDYDGIVQGSLGPYRNSGKLWIEPTNECDWSDLEWWRDWMLYAIQFAEDHQWPPLALPGLGPGYGDMEMFRVWSPVTNKLNDTGGLLSMHAYTVNDTQYLCDSNIYLGYRHRLNYGYMAAYSAEVDIAITEAAREWGGSVVDEGDFSCWWKELHENDPYVYSISLWLTGYHPQWQLANLEGHMLNISRKITNYF